MTKPKTAAKADKPAKGKPAELSDAARDEALAKLNLNTAQPDLVDIEGTPTPIRDIAFAAYIGSKLTIENWNKLTDEEREAQIVRGIDLLRAQAIEDAADAAAKRGKKGAARAVLVVATKRRGSTRRRAGFAFTSEPTELNAADLSEAVIAELEGDPDLVTSRQERD